MKHLKQLSLAAIEYLEVRNPIELSSYFDKHRNKSTVDDFSSADTYLMHCDLAELVKYINHPSPRIQKLISKRLEGEG